MSRFLSFAKLGAALVAGMVVGGAGYQAAITATPAQFETPARDTLIRGSLPTVYYYAADGYRYVFPNDKTFGSWFIDFGKITRVSDMVLGEIPIKGNVTYRPGVRLVKIQTIPKVYAVDRGGTLRWIASEAVAAALYGADWNKKIDDIPDVFFSNYEIGEPIASADRYDPLAAIREVPTINDTLSIPVTAGAPKASTELGSETAPRYRSAPIPEPTIPAPFRPFVSSTAPIATTTPAAPSAPSAPATTSQPFAGNASADIRKTDSGTGRYATYKLVITEPDGFQQVDIRTGEGYLISGGGRACEKLYTADLTLRASDFPLIILINDCKNYLPTYRLTVPEPVPPSAIPPVGVPPVSAAPTTGTPSTTPVAALPIIFPSQPISSPVPSTAPATTSTAPASSIIPTSPITVAPPFAATTTTSTAPASAPAATGQPDLTWDLQSMSPPSPAPLNTPITFTIRVNNNNGKGPVNNVVPKISVDGYEGAAPTFTNNCPPNLAVGATCTISFQLTYATAGSKNITIYLDPRNEISEWNEWYLNNIGTIGFGIISSTAKCTDSDNGKNYTTQGITRGPYGSGQSTGLIFGEGYQPGFRMDSSLVGESVYYDHCANATQLNEGFCDGTTLSSIGINCQYGCQNGVCLSAPAPATLPDLRAAVLDMQPGSPAPVNAPVTFTVRVTNFGDGTLAGVDRIQLISVDGVPSSVLGTNCSGGSDLTSMMSCTVTITKTFTTPGSQTLTVRVDPQGSVAESDESNNIFGYDFTIAAPVTASSTARLPGAATFGGASVLAVAIFLGLRFLRLRGL